MTEQRWRILLTGFAILPAALMLGVLLWVTTLARLQDAEAEFARQTEGMVNQLATSLDYPLMADQPDLAGHAVDRLLAQPGILQVRIRDAAQRRWMTRVRRDLPWPAEPRQGRWLTVPVRLLDDGNADFFQAAPSERPPLGWLDVEVDHGLVREREGHLLVQAGQISVAVLIALGIVCWLLTEWLARRIRRGLRPDEAMAEVDRHWGKLSHDLRTPLSGMTGMLELLSTTPLDEEQAGYLKHARDAAEALRTTMEGRGRLDRQLAEAGASPRLSGRRVLVVEDDMVSAHVLRAQLQALDLEVHLVERGEVALALADQAWDLVLLDGELPDMSADDCWRHWRDMAAARGWPLPAVACITAHDDGPTRRAFVEAGLRDILLKPVTQVGLMALLKHCLLETASADQSGRR